MLGVKGEMVDKSYNIYGLRLKGVIRGLYGGYN
jgi:hypothetical protein